MGDFMERTESIIFSEGVEYRQGTRSVPGKFKISLNFNPTEQDLIDRWRSHFTSVFTRWSALIVGGAGGAAVTLPVDFNAPASVDGSDNILAQGSWTALDGNRMPKAGRIKIDRADIGLMEQRDIVAAVLAHELGHAIGLGKKLWEARGLYHEGAGGPSYSGPNAMAVYGEWAGTGPARVPLEDTGGGGTRGQHWRLSTFGNREAMVGMISAGPRKFSRLTLAGLMDIGYTVNPAAADSFQMGERNRSAEPEYRCMHSGGEGGAEGVVLPEEHGPEEHAPPTS
jgi:hypothetical protein